MLPLNTNYYNRAAVSVFFFLFFYFLYLHNPRCGLYLLWSLSSSFRRMSCACTHRKILPAITPRNAGCISPRAGSRENLLTFFLSDEKESKQRKNRRHRFIGQFFFYTNGVNLNTLFPPSSFIVWLFHHHFLC